MPLKKIINFILAKCAICRKFAERRLYKRFRNTNLVVCSESEYFTKASYCRTLDVSYTGIGVQCRRPFATNTELFIQFHIPSTEKFFEEISIITMRGCVAHCRPGNFFSDRYVVGILFIMPPEEWKQYIIKKYYKGVPIVKVTSEEGLPVE